MTASPQLLPLRIRLPYVTEEEFIEKYGANIARGGVFVATRALKPEGTGLAFEFVLSDGSRVLRGEGVVVKAQADAGAGRTGMTVRFVKLDARSKALIDRVVSRRGGEPTAPSTASIETETPQAVVPEPAPTPAPPVEPASPKPASAAPPPGLVRRGTTNPSAQALTQVPAPQPPAPEAPAPTEQRPTPAPTAPSVPPNLAGRRSTPALGTAATSEVPAPTPASESPEPSSVVEPSAPPRDDAAAPPPPEPAPVDTSPAPMEPPAARADTPAPSEDARRATETRNRRRALLDVPVTAPTVAQGPEVVLGIDLGTTRARVAVFHEGRAQLIPTGAAGTAGLPSVLAVGEDGQLLVGEAAQAEAERSPRHAAFGLKRLLGMRARSPQRRWLEGLLPLAVVADAQGDASVELRGRTVPLSEFATLLMGELKSAASTYLGREVTRAVLCVPAWFNDRQRAALREAGAKAGLTVQRLLNAPAAAALAYGHGRGLARKRVLVVDLGGGSLEVAVVQVTGDDLEVVTTGSDATLGGMEFDARLAEAVASELQEQGTPRPEHPLDWSPLRAAAESAKVALSEREEAPVPLRAATVPPLPRERLEALTADLVQRVTGVVREVLESSALSPQGLDAVLLVGGQSRAPLVRRRLEESLGVPVRDDVDAFGAVALGAALLGHSLLQAEAGKPGASVSEVLTMPLGVAERGGGLRRILERNTRLPADKTLALPVPPGPLTLALFQGLAPLAADNEFLGTVDFTVERAGEAELHFSVSTDGTLSLAATLPGGKRQPVTLATHDVEDAARDALLARSPLASEPEPRPTGLLSGLKKLFGRR